MKSFVCFLLVCSLLFCCGLAEISPELRQSFEDYLTEIYSYTAKDAKAFIIEETESGLRAWHPDHPEWAYDFSYNNWRGIYDMQSPFTVPTELRYIAGGESYLRNILTAAQENEWLTRWNAEDREQFYQYATRFNELVPNLVWQYGRAQDNLTAAQAVETLFEYCFGTPDQWSSATTQWMDSICQSLPSYEPYALPDGIYSLEVIYGSKSCTITAFENEPPEGYDWEPFFEKGWQLRQGILSQYENSTIGIAFLEKDDELLTVILDDSGTGQIIPFSNTMLEAGKAYALHFDAVKKNIIIEETEEGKQIIQYQVKCYAAGSGCIMLNFSSYQITDLQTNSVFFLRYEYPDWKVSGTGLEVTKLSNFSCSTIWAAANLSTLPKNIDEIQEFHYCLFDQNFAVTTGSVHLRKKTSSHSKSLAQLPTGAILPILSVEEGTAAPWIHTKLGLLEGYVSSNYTRFTIEGVSYMNTLTLENTLTILPLPVAVTTKDTKLFNGTGLFRGIIQELEAGTRMHIIFESSNWLYVDIPQGDLDWDMDPYGTFGYINKNDVKTAYLPIQLDF